MKDISNAGNVHEEHIAANRQELIATVRRGLSLECDGCTFDDEGRFVTLSPTCTLHGQAEAALSALDRLLALPYKGFAEQVGWEDVEIALRAVLDDDEAVDAAMCLKGLEWAVVRVGGLDAVVDRKDSVAATKLRRWLSFPFLILFAVFVGDE